jgi:hypothetical protein
VREYLCLGVCMCMCIVYVRGNRDGLGMDSWDGLGWVNLRDRADERETLGWH